MQLKLLFLFTFFMCIFYRKFSYLGLPAPVPGGVLYISELFISIFFLLSALKLVVIEQTHSLIIKKDKVFFYYFLFSLSSQFALLYATWMEPGLTLREYAAYYYSFFFLMPLIALNTEKKFNTMINIIIVATIIACGLIIARCALKQGAHSGLGTVRYGNYETMGIIFLSSWMFRKVLNKWNIVEWIGLFIIFLITLFLINHRSAVISLLASITIVNYFHYSNNLLRALRNYVSVIYVFAILIIPIFFIYNDYSMHIIGRFMTTFTPHEEVNASWRLSMWQLAISDMDLKDWLIGKGWGWQIPILDFAGQLYGDKGEIRGFHNSGLYYFYHLGIFGLGAVVFFIISVYRRAILLTKNSHILVQRNINALISAHIGMIIFSVFNVVLEGPYMSFLFWITLGMIYIYPKIATTQEYSNE